MNHYITPVASRGLSGKESTCQAGDTGSIPGSGRSPERGNSNPFQYSCLENSMGRRAWQPAVHGVTKSWTQLSERACQLISYLHQLYFLKVGSEIFPSYLRVCPRITFVMTFYPHVLILITKISDISCQTKMSNCHDGSTISAAMFIVALFKTLLPLESICCCAVWKMVINPFLFFGLGCGKFVP